MFVGDGIFASARWASRAEQGHPRGRRACRARVLGRACVRRTRGEEGDLGGKRWAGRVQRSGRTFARGSGLARGNGDFAEHLTARNFDAGRTADLPMNSPPMRGALAR